jgi:tRNA-Thr(GGU) m(6)t(6)A37 methyltransferase TsaA
MRLLLEPVAEVRCPVHPVEKQWGDVLSELHFREELTEGLRGIDEFSHLLVVFWMHEASYLPERDLVRRPGGRGDMPRLGIFAQRASSRPNGLGVSVVRLLSHEKAVLSVQGLDALDGSPVLDVKPYFAEFDRAEAASEPRWVSRLMRDYF